MIDRSFWSGRRVLLTGHTGFKGSWASIWLSRLGAAVTGYSLPPPTRPSLFEQARVHELVRNVEGDVRDLEGLVRTFAEARPDVVIHMAAQALVRDSYSDPVGTYGTNVMGTVNVLEASRRMPGVRAVIVVTSDKCYENHEQMWPYRETDPMGGHDPYSSSKGCAELVTSAYRRSFLRDVGVASVRAGNVIGGGDWAKDRLVPDAIRAFTRSEKVVLRNPTATRPWQHVLDPLAGYLLVAERCSSDRLTHGTAWNFGPEPAAAWPVERVVDAIAREMRCPGWTRDDVSQPHEAQALTLDATKARVLLGWRPRLGVDQAISWTVSWYRDVAGGKDARRAVEADLEKYEASA